MKTWLAAALLTLLVALPAAAQTPDPARQIDLAEPDFTLSALPTTMRLPSGAFGFRLTHRFNRPIASGSAGDFFRDFFGFDGAARIGLEVRYGLGSRTQVIAHRTNDRAIQLGTQLTVFRQTPERWISVDGLFDVEGADNFTENYAGTAGAVVSHVFTGRLSIYAQPFVVWNVNAAPLSDALHDWTACVGIGARLRLGGSHVYVVAEAAPQVAGLRDGADHLSFGIERRAGAHMFQFTVSNALGTTYRQIARGGANPGDWYVGFNLTRRFY
jgi:hypothetical protein